jgi:hypothetical protein
MFNYLTEYIGKEVKITKAFGDNCVDDKGKVTKVLTYGECAVFIELDKNRLINCRYIVTIESI